MTTCSMSKEFTLTALLFSCLSLFALVSGETKNCDSVAVVKKPLSQVVKIFGYGHGELEDDNMIRSHPPFIPAPFVTKMHPFATKVGYRG
ncbi:hypothetical protein Btru_057505 [Bulinus truncatus]|nr:hypothetical protein Btru_057505 [Bulinus truncatus]